MTAQAPRGCQRCGAPLNRGAARFCSRLCSARARARDAFSARADRIDWSKRDAELKRNYRKMGKRRLARKLGVSRSALLKRAKRLGLCHPRNVWSEEDKRFLTAHAQEWSWRRLAKHFNRSIRAVQLQAYRLGLTAEDWRTEITATLAAEICGVETRTVTRWIERGWLKAIKTPPGSMCRIRPRDLRRFVLDNPTRIQWGQVGDMIYELVTLIAGEWGDAHAKKQSEMNIPEGP